MAYVDLFDQPQGLVDAVTQVLERSLTPGEEKKKEEIVKSMKKKGDFSKYGEDGESVMHATATKTAKKVAEEDDGEEKYDDDDDDDDYPKSKKGMKGKHDYPMGKKGKKGKEEYPMSEKYASEKPGKEDDGEGLDKVGKEDSDVDNDGDSDSSDSFLKARRGKIAKNIRKRRKEKDNGETEEDGEVSSSDTESDAGSEKSE